jgi:hypothetical protein
VKHLSHQSKKVASVLGEINLAVRGGIKRMMEEFF